jgi:hypothetical protein
MISAQPHRADDLLHGVEIEDGPEAMVESATTSRRTPFAVGARGPFQRSSFRYASISSSEAAGLPCSSNPNARLRGSRSPNASVRAYFPTPNARRPSRLISEKRCLAAMRRTRFSWTSGDRRGARMELQRDRMCGVPQARSRPRRIAAELSRDGCVCDRKLSSCGAPRRMARDGARLA